MTGDIQRWLDSLGLAKYGEVFAENEIDFGVLTHLDEDDLKDLGLPMGPRKKLLAAIAELETSAPAAAGPDMVAREAERRQLTVMFVDLVGSTALSERLDPEDLRDVMRRYQDAVAGAVTSYAGHVAKYLGDGVLAYFGWPQAHEDQAERAVRAGLDAVAAVSGLKLQDGVELEARAGIATGQVVIGDLVGEAGRDADAVTGETPNLAARLQDLGAAGQVVVGETTRRLIGDAFELDDLGGRVLKGFAEPIPAWRITGERLTESRFEAAHSAMLTPLVGREHELGLLLDRWARAKSGEGLVVVLSGEAGIGKSRLVQALREAIGAEPHTRLRYQCSPYHANSALYPVIRQLEHAAGFALEDDADARLDKLEAMIAPSEGAARETASLLADLLSLPGATRYGPLEFTPQQRKARTLEALIAELGALAAREPVLFVVEDAHWIDPTTQELMEQTAGRIDTLPVLMVVTHRPDYQPPYAGQPQVSALALNRLGRDQMAEMVRAVAGDESERIIGPVMARAEGIPLFVEELTKSVLEAGLGAAGETIEVPETLQASLLARLDRLGEARELAQIGAVIGREFSHDLLSAVVEGAAGGLAAGLDRLVSSQLVFQRGVAPDASYAFKHALVQDAAYGSLLRGRRQALHRRIAEALERRFPATVASEPEIVAHHYTRAGLTEQAIPHWHRAGERAVAASANAEATHHFERALELLDELPEDEERDRMELPLRLGLASALQRGKGHSDEAIEATLGRALELAERLGDADRTFVAMFGFWRYHMWRSGPVKGGHLGPRLLELAELSGSRADRMIGHYAHGSGLWLMGETVGAREHLQQACTLYEPGLRSALVYRLGHDQGVSSLICLAFVDWMAGYPDTAARTSEDGLALAAEIDDPFSSALANMFGCMIAEFIGDDALAHQRAEIVRELAARHDFPNWAAAADIHLGWGLARGERLDEGLALLRQGIEALEAIRTVLLRPYYLCRMAQTEFQAGEPARAQRTLARAHEMVQATGERFWEPELHRLSGVFAAADGDQVSAGASFERAFETVREMGAKSLELRAATSLAHLWQAQGKTAEARGLLAPVYDWFSEGFGTPDLKDANALLDELS